MENKKDIGKAFKDKLSHLEKTPNESVWNSINAELQQKKKRRTAFIPFWMKTAGIISFGLLVFFSAFMGSSENNYFFTPNDSNHIDSKTKTVSYRKDVPKEDRYKNTLNRKSNITIGDSESIRKTKIANPNLRDPLLSVKTQKPKQNSVENKQKQALLEKKHPHLFAKENKSRRNHNKKFISKNPKEQSNTNETPFLSENANTITTEPKLIAAAEDFTIDKSLNIAKKDTLKIKSDAILKLKTRPENTADNTVIDEGTFDLFVYGSPTYYDFISTKSSLDNRLDANAETSKIKFSYGIYLGYKRTGKWSFRFGISKINLSYQTKNVLINTPNYANINYSQNVSNASIYNQSNNSETMDVTQKISYTEVPLEVKYTFYNKKFGIDAITGISYLFLNENVIEAKPQNGDNITIGKTKNLSNQTFSANLGASFYYQFSEKLRWNVEPILKYHLNDYENAGANFKPYTLGIQTGLQYSFFKIKKNASKK